MNKIRVSIKQTHADLNEFLAKISGRDRTRFIEHALLMYGCTGGKKWVESVLKRQVFNEFPQAHAQKSSKENEQHKARVSRSSGKGKQDRHQVLSKQSEVSLKPVSSIKKMNFWKAAGIGQ